MIKEETLRRPEIKELFKVCGWEDRFIQYIWLFAFAYDCNNTVFVLFFYKTCPKPKLALNGVGGKSATELLRHLQ